MGLISLLIFLHKNVILHGHSAAWLHCVACKVTNYLQNHTKICGKIAKRKQYISLKNQYDERRDRADEAEKEKGVLSFRRSRCRKTATPKKMAEARG
jgi:cytidylate kinase